MRHLPSEIARVEIRRDFVARGQHAPAERAVGDDGDIEGAACCEEGSAGGVFDVEGEGGVFDLYGVDGVDGCGAEEGGGGAFG